MSEAAILQYGEDSGRSEYCIVYRSKDWSELRRVLINPRSHLDNQGDQNSSIQWELFTDCTMVLESAQESKEAGLRVALAFGILKSRDDEEEEDARELKVPSRPEILKFLEEELEDGGFVLDFSTQTRTILVRYSLPIPKPCQCPPPAMFSGKISTPTCVPIYEGSKKLRMGNMHFDIVSEPGFDELNRAELIIDYIQNPASVMCRLKSEKCYLGKAYLKVVKPHPTPSEKIEPVEPKEQLPRPTFERMKPDPRIVIEGLSMARRSERPEGPPPACNVCIDGVIYTNADYTLITVGGLIFKCYATPPGGMPM